jgi:Ca2+-binding RTX toxin-like protein
MWINWLVLAPTQYGFPVPTYENYGGPGYSDAHLLSPGETPKFAVTPGDKLDALFREHDRVYYSTTDATVLAKADLELIQGIAALPDSELSGEGHLYAGAAILALMANIAVTHKHPDLLTPELTALYTADAVDNLQKASVQPDSSEVLALVRWFDLVVSRIDEVGVLAPLIPLLTQAGFFNPVGTTGNDILLGGDGPDTIAGLAGNDFIHGFAGNDLLLGGTGSDILAGGLRQQSAVRAGRQ